MFILGSQYLGFDFLRRKIGAEIKTIRQMELKWQKRARKASEALLVAKQEQCLEFREELYNARMGFRREARVHNIAFAFLSNLPYYSVEQKVMRRNLPKDMVCFWQDVAEYVCSVTEEDFESALNKVLKWRDSHPGYSAITRRLTDGENIPFALIEKFGDYWLYAGVSNEETKTE